MAIRESGTVAYGWWKMGFLENSKKVVFGASGQSIKDLLSLKELDEIGKIPSMIDRLYSLEQMAEAHRYLDTGDKKGNIVMTADRGAQVSG